MLLDDKIVIVSGIGPGLGIELATLAAAEGAAGVVVAARTPASPRAFPSGAFPTMRNVRRPRSF